MVSPLASEGVGERRRELNQLKKKLADLRARYEATRRKVADTKAALEAAELNLSIRTAERRLLEIRTEESRQAATKSRAERDEALRETQHLRTDVEQRLSALYRMGRLGYFQPLIAADSGLTLLRSLQLLSFLVRRDATLLRRYEDSLALLKTREGELAGRQKDLASLVAESRRKEQEVAQARAEQASLLARLQRSSEEQQVQVTRLEDKTERLGALLDLLESRGRVLAPGATSIRRYKGALDWPVRGKVAVPFGRIANPKFPKTFLRSNGWTIDAPPGSDVKAVFAGEVAYAQWLKGYGNLVVVDHGDGVFSLYGRLTPGTVPRGAHVALGERVGKVGEPPEDEVNGLYFEVRDSRASVDPQTWLR